MDTRYDPKLFEGKWYKFWQDGKYFSSEPNDKKVFTVLLPPPNVTGSLHMGHALNCTYQDILCRYHKLNGYNVCWIPGTDHAGIATQNVVERELLKEGLKKDDLGKKEFIKKIYEWKEKKGNYIIDQLKKLGCSCDWNRERFTMDNNSSECVKKCFFDLYNKGLIYKNKYIVNNCPRCKTALADDEVEYEDQNTKMYYLKYFHDDNISYEIIATTRPETIFGDCGIAYYPSNEKFMNKHIYVKIPLTNKRIKLYPDHIVKSDFGSGLVKLTPAHDKNDFMAAQRLGLEYGKDYDYVIDNEGKIISDNKKYHGIDRFECRTLIVKDLQDNGFIEKIEEYNNSIGKCYRCSTIVEPYLSDQWFVKMKPLAEKAIDVVKSGEIKLIPDNNEIIYYNWLENTTDWCISRQIWWGHDIPIYYCNDCNNVMCSISNLEKCNRCNNSNVYQDSDVLDTWFSSWLWAFSVFHPDEYNYYCPIDFITSGSDILFFWISRMIMASLEFKNKIPFKNVYLHGIVRDSEWNKMSKSKGNAIDPNVIIDKYSADILRFTLAMTTPKGTDVGISEKSFDIGMTFCTKLWNAVRYCTMNITWDIDININNFVNDLDDIDKWILNKLNKLIDSINNNYKEYNFSKATTDIYTFVWNDFCNKYLELVKMQMDNILLQKKCSNVLVMILEILCRLLHPTIPFITEEIWQIIKKLIPQNHNIISILDTSYPCELKINYDNKDISFDIMDKIIQKIRNIKTEYNVNMKENKLDFIVDNLNNNIGYIKQYEPYMKKLCKHNTLELHENKINNRLISYEIDNNIMIYIKPSIDLNIEKKIQILENKKLKVNDKIDKILIDIKKCSNDQTKKIQKLNDKIHSIKPEIDKINEEIKIMQNYI